MATWNLDNTHSNVGFKVKHMMISNVSGSVNDFTVNLESEKEDFTDAKVTFVGKMASISTQNEQRDEHLKSADFFDAATYPEMKFVSTSISKKDDTDYVLEGDLTIKDVTKKVLLDVEYGGTFVDPWGQSKSGFSLSGKINREEFGLNYNAVLESGGVLIGKDVKIQAEVQFVKA